MSGVSNANTHGHGHRNLADLSLTELQEIAMRQQQQIEINQQLLHAKEKRLKVLKSEESSKGPMASGKGTAMTAAEAHQLDALKQSVLGQELKIFKLKQLRNQILEYKLSNSNMYSELDLIKSLFEQKERELFAAISKVSELSKQIEQLRKLKHKNQQASVPDPQQALSAANSHITELERLKQELQIRNKLNEQQAKKIIAQQDLFNKKQLEVLGLDKRIEELKERIASKRNYLINNQINLNSVSPAAVMPPHHAQPSHYHQQQHPASLRVSQGPASNLHSPMTESGGGGGSQPQQLSQSPSKLVAKFATKQEIANTYMNKFNSDAYQKYQARMFQQQQPPPLVLSHSPSASSGSGGQQATTSEPGKTSILDEALIEAPSSFSAGSSTSNNPGTTAASMSTTNAIAAPASSSSSLVSLSPISNASGSLAAPTKGCRKASYDPNSQTAAIMMATANLKLEDASALPSHLKLEFDKIKYLPDVVKTIKKRHSISEIESSNTLPPQIFQKILEKHHKNFLDQQTAGSSGSGLSNPSKLNQICELAEVSSLPAENQTSSSAQQQQQQQPVKLTTFMSHAAKPQSTSPPQQPQETIEVVENSQSVSKSTKSIIKQTGGGQSTEGTENNGATTTTAAASRRVNFDPHALLLDAAVEGELDLVIKCAKQVRDISQPNDEGITALHNSVCAGHFNIVKFLVDYGCEINFADNDGWTPLHCAASCNNLQMIRFLIESGASLFATTLSDNETAIRKCEEEEEGFQACYDYLAQAQAQIGSPEFNAGQVYALYDYEAQNDDELSFKCSQRLVVVDKCEGENDANDGWWLCRLDSGQEGLAPKNYLGLYPKVRPGSADTRGKSQEESTFC